MAKAKKARASGVKKKSASKKPAARAAAAKSEPVKPSEVTKLPPASVVTETARLAVENQSKVGTYAGNISDAYRAAKSKGLHPGAHKLAVKLKGIASTNVRKASDFLDHLDYYLEKLGVLKLIENQPELPIASGGETEAEEVAPEKPVAAPKAQRAQPSAQADRTTFPLDDKGTVVRPNFTQPEAEEHIRDAQKALN